MPLQSLTQRTVDCLGRSPGGLPEFRGGAAGSCRSITLVQSRSSSLAFTTRLLHPTKWPLVTVPVPVSFEDTFRFARSAAPSQPKLMGERTPLMGFIQRTPLRRHCARASTPSGPKPTFALSLPSSESFRPYRSSRLRRFSPRVYLRVCCTPQPTMGFAGLLLCPCAIPEGLGIGGERPGGRPLRGQGQTSFRRARPHFRRGERAWSRLLRGAAGSRSCKDRCRSGPKLATAWHSCWGPEGPWRSCPSITEVFDAPAPRRLLPTEASSVGWRRMDPALPSVARTRPRRAGGSAMVASDYRWPACPFRPRTERRLATGTLLLLHGPKPLLHPPVGAGRSPCPSHTRRCLPTRKWSAEWIRSAYKTSSPPDRSPARTGRPYDGPSAEADLHRPCTPERALTRQERTTDGFVAVPVAEATRTTARCPIRK
jgi:hypothetical protein